MTDASADEVPLTWSHAIHDVSARGLDIKRAASNEERLALTKALDVLSVDRFETAYRVTAQSGHRYRIVGTFEADLSQACVVTLDPVRGTIKEEFAVGFCPEEKNDTATDAERSVLDEPDVEILTSDNLEIGRILYELLAAAVDPFPRKDGAEFSFEDRLGGADKPGNPFAVLATLKKDS
jgi:uncharacterized metal-binding protein YceD (DUF177 family)